MESGSGDKVELAVRFAAEPDGSARPSNAPAQEGAMAPIDTAPRVRKTRRRSGAKGIIEGRYTSGGRESISLRVVQDDVCSGSGWLMRAGICEVLGQVILSKYRTSHTAHAGCNRTVLVPWDFRHPRYEFGKCAQKQDSPRDAEARNVRHASILPPAAPPRTHRPKSVQGLPAFGARFLAVG